MLFRKGNKWLWIINLIGMILLTVLPLKIAHQMVLPILWFLQVNRLSDLTTKETTNNVHYFTYTSFKPIGRLLISQIIAAVVFMLLLAAPLIIRLGLSFNVISIISITLGSVFIVLLATSLGIVSKGKKLFEVLFFMISYININGIVFADYFGGFSNDYPYILKMFFIIAILATVTFLIRKQRLYK